MDSNKNYIPVRGLDISDPVVEAKLESLVGPPGKWRETRDFQLHLLSLLGLKQDMVLLDVGCGSLRAGLPLIAYLDSANYIGIDAAPECISAAMQLVSEFDLTAKRPLLLSSQTFGIEELGYVKVVDRIWSYQVLIHFTEDDVHRFMNATAQMLKTTGKAWASVQIAKQDLPFKEVGNWRNYPVNSATLDFYQSAAQGAGLSCEVLGTLSDFGLSLERKGSANKLIELRHSTVSRE